MAKITIEIKIGQLIQAMQRHFFLVICGIWFLSNANAQRKHFSLGINHNGICIGPSFNTNGIRLNLWDQDLTQVNGINLAFRATANQVNGISAGVLFSADSIVNGIHIGGVTAYADKLNGISTGIIASTGGVINGLSVGGLICGAEKMNGVGIGMILIADTMNGFFYRVAWCFFSN